MTEQQDTFYGIIFISDGRVLTSQGFASTTTYLCLLEILRDKEILYKNRYLSINQLDTFTSIATEIGRKEADMAMRDKIEGLLKKLEGAQK